MAIDIQTILLTAFGTALTGLLTWAVSLFTSWLGTKIKNKKFVDYINQILNITTTAVQATYQSYVESLKGTNMWTKEAQQKALEMALATIKKELSTELLDFINKNFGDINAYLTNLIESVLYKLKN